MDRDVLCCGKRAVRPLDREVKRTRGGDEVDGAVELGDQPVAELHA